MTLEEQLIRDEGYREKPYMDTVGKLTIGVGRNLTDVGLRRDEVMYLLRRDIVETRRVLYQALPWVEFLDPVRQAVLLNMAFNLGIGGLLGFTNALAATEAKNWPAAAREMLSSKWAKQVGPRAIRLAKQMETGEWQ